MYKIKICGQLDCFILAVANDLEEARRLEQKFINDNPQYHFELTNYTDEYYSKEFDKVLFITRF